MKKLKIKKIIQLIINKIKILKIIKNIKINWKKNLNIDKI